METTNKAMVDFFHHLTEMNQEKGMQNAKLIARIKIITKLITWNSTKEPLQEEESKEKSATTKNMKDMQQNKPEWCW